MPGKAAIFPLFIGLALAVGACFPTLDDPPTDPDAAHPDDRGDDAFPDSSPPDAADGLGDATTGLSAPLAVDASTDLEDRIVITWSLVEGASGYELLREGSVIALVESGLETSFDDRSASLAVTEAWAAPGGLEASDDQPDRVVVTWRAPPRPRGPTARYAVATIGADGQRSASSAEVIGHRAAPAIVDWEVEVAVEDAAATQLRTGRADTRLDDLGASAPSVEIERPTASVEAHHAFVRLSVGDEVVAPTVVQYRVRGLLEGTGATPWSGAASGHVSTAIQEAAWEWAPTPDGPWTDLPTTTRELDDTGAPADGSWRHYRRRVRLEAGVEVFSPESPGRRLAFVDVGLTGGHACALSAGGRLWCWGWNGTGELGREPTASPSTIPELVIDVPPMTSLALGTVSTGFGGASYFTCARSESSEVWCWGGIFGPADEDLSPARVEGTTDALSLHGGLNGACVSLPDARVRCWGWRGLGNVDVSISREAVDVHRTTSGTPLGAGEEVAAGGGFGGCVLSRSGVWSNSPVSCWPGPEVAAAPLPFSGAVRNLWRGGGASTHRCLITTDGAAWCWGFGTDGQLGDGIKEDRALPVPVFGLSDSPIVEISPGGHHTCARQLSGTIRCWGNGQFGQLGHGQSGPDIEALAPATVQDADGMTHIIAGGNATCGLKDHMVHCWGANTSGQLGTGDTFPRSVPTPIVVP